MRIGAGPSYCVACTPLHARSREPSAVLSAARAFALAAALGPSRIGIGCAIHSAALCRRTRKKKMVPVTIPAGASRRARVHAVRERHVLECGQRDDGGHVRGLPRELGVDDGQRRPHRLPLPAGVPDQRPRARQRDVHAVLGRVLQSGARRDDVLQVRRGLPFVLARRRRSRAVSAVSGEQVLGARRCAVRGVSGEHVCACTERRAHRLQVSGGVLLDYTWRRRPHVPGVPGGDVQAAGRRRGVHGVSGEYVLGHSERHVERHLSGLCANMPCEYKPYGDYSGNEKV